jgi:curved DNA-binding protein CbpA
VVTPEKKQAWCQETTIVYAYLDIQHNRKLERNLPSFPLVFSRYPVTMKKTHCINSFFLYLLCVDTFVAYFLPLRPRFSTISSDSTRFPRGNFPVVFSSARDEMSWDPKAAPKLDFDEDFYSVLEVDPSIGSKDLKRAYYKIVFMYHPDNKEGDEAKAVANKQMMVINGAYRILKNSFLRKLYDKQRKRGLFGVKAGVKESDAGGSRGGSKNNEDDDPDPPANSNVPPSTKYRSATNSETTEAYGRADGGERGSGRPATSTGSGNSKGGSSYSSSSATDEEFIRDSYRRQRERFNAYQSESEPQPQPQPQRVTSNAEDGDDSTGGESRYYRGGGFDTSYVEGGRGDTRSQDVFNDNMLDEVAEFLRRTGTAVSGRFISTIQALRVRMYVMYSCVHMSRLFMNAAG